MNKLSFDLDEFVRTETSKPIKKANELSFDLETFIKDETGNNITLDNKDNKLSFDLDEFVDNEIKFAQASIPSTDISRAPVQPDFLNPVDYPSIAKNIAGQTIGGITNIPHTISQSAKSMFANTGKVLNLIDTINNSKIGKFVSKVIPNVKLVQDTADSIIQNTIGDLTPEDTKKANGFLAKLGNTINDYWEDNIKKGQKPEDIISFKDKPIQKTIQTLASLAPQIPIMFSPAGLVALSSLEAGDIYQKVLEKTGDKSKASLAGLVAGVSASLTEKLPFEEILKGKSPIKAGLYEAIQEIFQGDISNIIEETATGEKTGRGWEERLGEAIGGAGLGGAGAYIAGKAQGTPIEQKVYQEGQTPLPNEVIPQEVVQEDIKQNPLDLIINEANQNEELRFKILALPESPSRKQIKDLGIDIPTNVISREQIGKYLKDNVSHETIATEPVAEQPIEQVVEQSIQQEPIIEQPITEQSVETPIQEPIESIKHNIIKNKKLKKIFENFSRENPNLFFRGEKDERNKGLINLTKSYGVAEMYLKGKGSLNEIDAMRYYFSDKYSDNLSKIKAYKLKAKSILDTINSNGLRIISKLNPQNNKKAEMIINAAKNNDNLYFWEYTQNDYQNAWNDIIIPQLKEQGYDAIKYLDDINTGETIAVFDRNALEEIKIDKTYKETKEDYVNAIKEYERIAQENDDFIIGNDYNKEWYKEEAFDMYQKYINDAKNKLNKFNENIAKESITKQQPKEQEKQVEEKKEEPPKEPPQRPQQPDEPKLAISKFRTNLKKFHDDIIKNIAPEEEFTYIKTSNDKRTKEAIEALKQNANEIYNDIVQNGIKSSDGTAVFEAKLLAYHFLDKKDLDKFNIIMKKLQEKATETAQTLESFNDFKNKIETQIDAIYQANKIVNSMQNKNLTAKEKVEKETDAIMKVINETAKQSQQEFLEQIFNKLDQKKKTTGKKQTLKDFSKKLDDIASKALNDFKEATKGTRLNAGIPIDALYHLTKYGAVKLAKGTVDFTIWSQEMIAEIGDFIKPNLQDIYDKAKAESINIIDEAMGNEQNSGQANSEKLSQIEEARKKKLEALLKPKTTKKHKELFDKIMDLINMGAFNREDVAQAVAKKYKLPVLTKHDSLFILQLTDGIEKLDKDSYAYRHIIAQLDYFLAKKQNVNIIKKAQMVQRLALLLSMKLFTKSALVQPLLSALDITSKTFISPIVDKTLDPLIKKLYPESQRAYYYNIQKDLETFIKGYLTGGKEFVQDFKNLKAKGIKDFLKKFPDMVSTTPLATALEIGEARRTLDGIVGGNLEQLANQLLRIVDIPLFKGFYNFNLQQIKNANSKADINAKLTEEEMQNEAKEQALISVLQSLNSPMYKVLKGVKKFPILGSILQPFVLTPGNGLDKTIDYALPQVSALKALWKLTREKIKTKLNYDEKDIPKFNRREFIDQISFGLTGTGLLYLGGKLFEMGLITGGDDDDDEKNVQNLKRYAGQQPYGLVVGDKIHNLNSYENAGIILKLGAILKEKFKEDKPFMEKLFNASIAMPVQVFESSLLMGYNQVFYGGRGYGEEDKGLIGIIPNMIKTKLGQLTPRFRRELEAFSNENINDMYSDRALGEYANIAKNIIGAKKFIPKISVWGEKVERDIPKGVLSRGLRAFIDPVYKTTLKKEGLESVILDIYEKTKNTIKNANNIIPSINYTGNLAGEIKLYNTDMSHEEIQKFKKEYRVDDKIEFDIKLTPELRVEYNKINGRLNKEKFSEYINSDIYKFYKKEKQFDKIATKMKSINNDIDKEAKKEFINKYYLDIIKQYKLGKKN
jgi:hypothetical protein